MSTKKSESSHTSHIRIAVTHIASELSFESSTSPSDIKTAVAESLANGTPLTLSDVRGHEIIVPADKIGYVEIGLPSERRVGFGAV